MIVAEAPKCLWIARELPFPLDSGDRIYSAKLAQSLSQAGAEVHFVGLESESAGFVPAGGRMVWDAVPGQRRRYVAAVFSRYPLTAAAHATATYRRRLRALLQQPWDVVVFEHFGSGWALREFGDQLRRTSPRPVLIHVSHNYEAPLARSLIRSARSNLVRRLALWQNYLKILAMERQLVRGVDITTTITEEDARSYRTELGAKHIETLTPGYSGPICPARVIDHRCPRRVILVGSFRWVVKQENLRQLVRLADPLFAKAGIQLDVVGVVPDELRRELSAEARATQFHGFVDDLGNLFANARLALVPEIIGGGFKLKFLDYIFSRVPTASLSQAVAGLPERLVSSMISARDIGDLVRQVVAVIDDDARLNSMQETAFETARSEFDWGDRGNRLLGALNAGRLRAATGTGQP